MRSATVQELLKDVMQSALVQYCISHATGKLMLLPYNYHSNCDDVTIMVMMRPGAYLACYHIQT
jgi:hypothetical protein